MSSDPVDGAGDSCAYGLAGLVGLMRSIGGRLARRGANSCQSRISSAKGDPSESESESADTRRTRRSERLEARITRGASCNSSSRKGGEGDGGGNLLKDIIVNMIGMLASTANQMQNQKNEATR